MKKKCNCNFSKHFTSFILTSGSVALYFHCLLHSFSFWNCILKRILYKHHSIQNVLPFGCIFFKSVLSSRFWSLFIAATNQLIFVVKLASAYSTRSGYWVIESTFYDALHFFAPLRLFTTSIRSNVSQMFIWFQSLFLEVLFSSGVFFLKNIPQAYDIHRIFIEKYK